MLKAAAAKAAAQEKAAKELREAEAIMSEDIPRQAKKKKLGFKHYIALLQKMGIETKETREGKAKNKLKATLETEYWEAQPAEPQMNEIEDDDNGDNEGKSASESASESESESGSGSDSDDSDSDMVDKKAVAVARAERAKARAARRG